MITLEEVQSKLSYAEELKVPVPVYEYLLGIADLTGEQMRLCINAVGRGEKQLVFNTCLSLRKVHEALSSLKYDENLISNMVEFVSNLVLF